MFYITYIIFAETLTPNKKKTSRPYEIVYKTGYISHKNRLRKTILMSFLKVFALKGCQFHSILQKLIGPFYL